MDSVGSTFETIQTAFIGIRPLIESKSMNVLYLIGVIRIQIAALQVASATSSKPFHSIIKTLLIVMIAYALIENVSVFDTIHDFFLQIATNITGISGQNKNIMTPASIIATGKAVGSVINSTSASAGLFTEMIVAIPSLISSYTAFLAYVIIAVNLAFLLLFEVVIVTVLPLYIAFSVLFLSLQAIVNIIDSLVSMGLVLFILTVMLNPLFDLSISWIQALETTKSIESMLSIHLDIFLGSVFYAFLALILPFKAISYMTKNNAHVLNPGVPYSGIIGLGLGLGTLGAKSVAKTLVRSVQRLSKVLSKWNQRMKK